MSEMHVCQLPEGSFLKFTKARAVMLQVQRNAAAQCCCLVCRVHSSEFAQELGSSIPGQLALNTRKKLSVFFAYDDKASGDDQGCSDDGVVILRPSRFDS